MSTSTPSQWPAASSTSSQGQTVTLLVSSLVALTVIVGLIVLIALKDLTWGDAGPLIGALAGVHGGAAISGIATR